MKGKDRKQMKIDNPRGNKRGGNKVKKRKEVQNDFVWELHVKLHHKAGLTRRQQCHEPKCPLKGKTV